MMKKCQPRSLTPFIDGELPEDAGHEMEEHLQSCPACSAKLDELTAASQQVRAMGRSEIPNDSLKSALEVIAGRAGLSADKAMTTPPEIAGAQLDDALGTAVKARPESKPAALGTSEELPAVGIPGDLYWDQPPASIGPRVEPMDTVAADKSAEPAPADGPETVPMWVEPERWHPTGHLVEAGAPAFVPRPRSRGATPRVDLAAPDPAEGKIGQVAPVEDAEPEPNTAALETHPSPPPAQLVPSWMEAPAASDAELEAVGRAAIEDAIGSPAEPVAESTAAVEMAAMADSAGPTAAADAAMRGPDESSPTGNEDAAGAAEAPRRSRFAAILGSRSGKGSENATAPEEPRSVLADADSEPTTPTPAAVERPEAEHLMWITPRTPGVDPAGEPQLEPVASTPAIESDWEAPDDNASLLRGYREALLGERAKPGARTWLLSSPQMRIRVGLGAALVVILVVAGILYATQLTHPSSTSATQPTTSHAAASSPAGLPTPSVRPTTTASPAAGAAPGPLSAVVTAGSGGTGWTVSRIRIGSPGKGITRVVLDLAGGGSTPTAQLGRGSDGSIYLSVPGLTIPTSAVSGVTPTGALTAITEVGGSGGDLRFNTNGSPGFSIGYLSGPNRLVLDFK